MVLLVGDWSTLSRLSLPGSDPSVVESGQTSYHRTYLNSRNCTSKEKGSQKERHYVNSKVSGSNKSDFLVTMRV